MLSYRSLSAFEKMISFIEMMPAHVKNTVMVQEQLGFALNRIDKKNEAIEVLESVLKQNGPSSETYGILGRVYKDKYDAAAEEENEIKAAGFLDKAIEIYQKGFEVDWRDAYPGVNLLNLLEIKGEKDMINTIAPVVDYSVNRKIQTKSPDYWDYATLIEIALIVNDDNKAYENLQKAFASEMTENWMLESTMDTLLRLSGIKAKRNENTIIIDKYFSLLKEELDRRKKKSR